MPIPTSVVRDAMKASGGWKIFLGEDGFMRTFTRETFNKGLQIFPSVESDDATYLRFLAEMSTALEREYPATVDADGFLDASASPGGYLALRTVAGYRMDPISVPPRDSDAIRDSKGLEKGFVSPRDEAIAARLFDLMFVDWEENSLALRRSASFGPPLFASAMIQKKASFQHVVSNLSEILQLSQRNRFVDLWLKHRVAVISATGERNQTDKVWYENGRLHVKARPVELADGERIDADRTVIINGRVIPDFFNSRRRLVYAVSGSVNYLFAAIFSLYRKVYLNRFAYTWKHKGRTDVLEKVSRFNAVVGVDVSNFDTTYPDFLVKWLENRFAKRWHPGLVSLLHAAMRPPIAQTYPWMGEYDPEKIWTPFVGDPMSGDRDHLKLGLPSGIAPNPDFGKFAMTWAYLCLLDRQFGDCLENMEVILLGKHPRYGLLDMGDDAVLMFDEPTDGSAVRQRIKTGEYPKYFLLDEETPVSFLGELFYKNSAGKLDLAPNLKTYFTNWLNPEHGISMDGRGHRIHYQVGFYERNEHYSAAPLFRDAYKLYTDVFRKHFSVAPMSLIDSVPRPALISSVMLSPTDRAFLENPDAIHYKIDPADVTPAVLALEHESMPFESFSDLPKFMEYNV